MSPNELPSNVCASLDVILGEDVQFGPFVNLYGCSVGDSSRIGAFVEVQRDAHIGKRCKISSHSFICSGVTIEDEVFIGHGVLFINDRHPRATNPDGTLEARRRLDSGAHLRAPRRLDRKRRDNHVRSRNWSEGDGCRRCVGDQ